MNFIQPQFLLRPARLALLTLILTSMASAQVAPQRRTQPRQARQNSAEMRVERDLPYVPGESNPLQSLDIYAPKTRGATALPVVIFIHGGGFITGDKGSGAASKSLAFTQRGFMFVSLNYRLSPAVQHPVHAQDVAKAIAWTKANIARYGGNPDRLFVMGHSSGAHLAAMVAINPRFLGAEGLKPRDLSGAILLDGATYDLEAALADAPRKLGDIETAFGADRAVWRDGSPANQVAKSAEISPFLMFHLARREASHQQAESLAAALAKAGVPARVEPAADKTHQSLNREIGAPGDVPTRQIFDFLQSLPPKGSHK